MPNVTITLISPAFKNGDFIPRKYSCQGEDINPALQWKGIPSETKSLVLVVDDPDAPGGTWTHWLVWNINPQIASIAENSVPPRAILGTNNFQKLAYGGPCPPSGVHRYFFKLYALDTILHLPTGAGRSQLETMMKNHVLAQGILMGRYAKEVGSPN